MRPANSGSVFFPSGKRALALAVGLLAVGLLASAQQPQRRNGEFTLVRDVDLVVLHTTVVDRGGRLVTDLEAQNFAIFENDIKQKLSVFRREDVPITVGLVLDNSASMTEKREEMRAGALAFVELANPRDEFFVVNFNSDYYLDLESGDFTNDMDVLQAALLKTKTRGGTAFYDALRASLKHIHRGSRQKKILLVITDGVDHLSYSTYEAMLLDAQQSETALYLVGLPCTEEKRDCRRARRILRKLADVTGGMAYFPISLNQVQTLCRQIAHDIRNQYILAYYPSNSDRDGSFRRVRVKVDAPKRYKKVVARHRPGYYASSDRDGAH